MAILTICLISPLCYSYGVWFVLRNFIEITLWHRYSHVNLLYIFRITFPKNTSGGLLLLTTLFYSFNHLALSIFGFTQRQFAFVIARCLTKVPLYKYVLAFFTSFQIILSFSFISCNLLVRSKAFMIGNISFKTTLLIVLLI